MSKIYDSVEDLVGHTPLVKLHKIMKRFELKANLIVKCEFYNPIFSIKDRIALKQQKEYQEAESIANEIFGSVAKQSDLYFKPKGSFPGIPAFSELPLDKQKMLSTAFTKESSGYSESELKSKADSIKLKGVISETPKPASGRVLKASFDAKTGDKPKAVIVSAADHAKQKAEERAKKIQDFFKAKHPEATVMPDGTPVKRGRGRPRKNPIV